MVTDNPNTPPPWKNRSDDYLVIELTEDQLKNLPLGIDVVDSLLNHQDVFLKAPQPKLVHLSDLPDGTPITAVHSKLGNISFFKDNGYASKYKNAVGGYKETYLICLLTGYELIPGEWRVWRGGKCPWPEHVEVEVCMVMADLTREYYKSEAACLDWNRTGSGQIIAHRCTGRLLDGAKLVP